MSAGPGETDSDPDDIWYLGQLFTNIVPLLILASMAVSLVVFAPWGRDLIYSSLPHFFTLFPLFVLAFITYVARAKLIDEDREVSIRLR